MKGMVFLFICWATIANIFAQTFTFSKIFSNFPLNAENGWTIDEIPGGYITVSTSRCLNQVPDEVCCAVTKMDKNGNVVWFKQYDFYPTHNGLVVKDDKIYVSGTDEGQYSLWCVDMEGNVIWAQTYGDPFEDEGSPALLLTSENQFILCGAKSRIDLGTGKWLVYLVKTDMDGNWIAEFTYGAQNDATLSRKIIESSLHEIVFSYSYCPGSCFLDFRAGVTSIDAAGNINWSADFPFAFQPGECYIIQTDSNNLVAKWNFDTIGPNFVASPPVLYYLNLSGQPQGKLVLWGFPLKDMRGLEPVWNKGLVGCGSDHFVNTLEGTTGWIFRVNENRELLWERMYTDTTWQGFPFGLDQIKPTEDGGFIAVGTMNNTMTGVLESHNWILKLDSLGCLQPGCGDLNFITTTTETVFLKGKDIEIWPNPGNGYINIRLPEEVDSLKKMVVNVVSNDGKSISQSNLSQSETRIDLTAAPTGVYYVIISQLNEVITSKKIVIVR